MRGRQIKWKQTQIVVDQTGDPSSKRRLVAGLKTHSKCRRDHLAEQDKYATDTKNLFHSRGSCLRFGSIRIDSCGCIQSATASASFTQPAALELVVSH